MGCVFSQDAQEDGIDDISPEEINANIKPVEFERQQNLHVLQLGLEEIVVDYGFVSIRGNQMVQNYRGKGEGQLIQIILMNHAEIQDLKLYHNGDISLMTHYTNQSQFWLDNSGIHFQTVSKSSLEDFAVIPSSISPFLGDSLLFIAKMKDFTINGLQAVQNWYFDTSSLYFSHFLTIFDSSLQTHDIQVRKLIEGDLIVERLIGMGNEMKFSELVDWNEDVGLLQGSLFHSDSITFQNFQISRVHLQSALVHSVQQGSYSLVNMKFTNISAHQLVQANALRNLMIKECEFVTFKIFFILLECQNSFIYNSYFSNQNLENGYRLYNQFVLQVTPQFQTFLIHDSTFHYPCGRFNCPEYPFIFTVMGQIEVINSTFTHYNGGDGRNWFYFYRGHGVFKNSIFEENNGVLSSVARVAGFSSLDVYNCSFVRNSAETASTLRIQEYGSLKVYDSNFIENKASKQGGAFGYAGSVNFEFYNCRFERNEAGTQGSVLQGFSQNKNNVLTFKDCLFLQNRGKSTMYVLQSNLLFDNLTYSGNLNQQGESAPLYFMATSIQIIESVFDNEEKHACSDNNSNLGGYIDDITDNVITIVATSFRNVCAKQGGAIYMGGFSDIMISESEFSNCRSVDRGGAIFAINFNSWKIENSSFQSNYAKVRGADILAQESTSAIHIQNSRFTGENVSPISLDRTCLNVTDSIFTQITTESSSHMVECQLCRGSVLTNNEFTGLRNSAGILINGVTHSESHLNQFVISRNKFEDIVVKTDGGAIYLGNPGNVSVEKNTFAEIKVNSEDGEGGAIFYRENENDKIALIENNTFVQNSAKIGGAISWKNKSPTLANNSFVDNKADTYGEDVASYARKLSFIGNETGEELRQQFKHHKLTSPMRRIYLEDIRSGSKLPVLYISQLDRYSQVVSRQSRQNIFTSHYQKLEPNQEPSKYIPLLSNENRNEWINGIMKLEDITLIGEPGKDYIVEITSPLIDESLLDTQEYLNDMNLSGVNVEINIKFRNCIVGEAFLKNGACQTCPVTTYLLQAPMSPTECLTCPENAVCYGGDQIGPVQGYWRSSAASINFIPCFNYEACLGSLAGSDYEALGSCEVGYHGILCASCETGYTRSSIFECKKCPSMAGNITIMALILVAFSVVIVLVIKFTILSATKKRSLFTVLFKIMINHLQVLMLVSSFKFEWPQEIVEFFNASKSVANAPQQIFSIDCFIQGSIGKPLKRFYIYLIIYTFIPVLVAFLAYLFFRLKYLRRSRISFGKSLTAFLIVFFLIHPSLTRAVLDAFQQVGQFTSSCKNIDGTDYMTEQLTEICWRGDHLRYGVSFGTVGILLWVVGIPLISFILLYKERTKLNSIIVKQKYGFLFNGYNNNFYYWEIVNASRKVLIAFVSVFLVAQGTMIQSLVLLLVLVGTILITLKVKPYVESEINFLEIYSMISLIITVYCGIYYLSSRASGSPQFITGKDFTLNSSQKWVLFLSITLSNGSFFLIWSSFLYRYLKKNLREKCKRCYICFCLLGSRRHYVRETTLAQRESARTKKIANIERVREELDKFKQMYKKKIGFENKEALEGYVTQFLIQFSPETCDDSMMQAGKEHKKKGGSVVPMIFTDKLKSTNQNLKGTSSTLKEETELSESNPSTNRPLFDSPREHYIKHLRMENPKKLSTFTPVRSDQIARSFIHHLEKKEEIPERISLKMQREQAQSMPRKLSTLKEIEAEYPEKFEEETKEIGNPHQAQALNTEPHERNLVTTQMSSMRDYQLDLDLVKPRSKSQRRKSQLRKGIKRVFFDDNYKH